LETPSPPCGFAAPAICANVGGMSHTAEGKSDVVPGAMRPGQRAMNGTRMPPRTVSVNFRPRRGPALLKNAGSDPPAVAGPLCLENITTVLSASFSSASRSRIRPTSRSSRVIIAVRTARGWFCGQYVALPANAFGSSHFPLYSFSESSGTVNSA
jgi:hypothetical protein